MAAEWGRCGVMWVGTAAAVSPVALHFAVPAEPSGLRISSFLHWSLELAETHKRSGDRPREDAKVSVDSAGTLPSDGAHV